MASRAVTALFFDTGRRVFFAGIMDYLFCERNSHSYVLKSCGRRTVPRPHRLHRLTFSAIRRAPQSPIIARANRVTAIPKFRSDAAITGMLNHSALFAALNFPADFGGKLEMVAAVVDGTGAICFHVNRIVRIRQSDTFIFPFAGMNADVGHANNRQAIPAFRSHRAAAAIQSNARGGFAIGKISSGTFHP